MAYVAVSGIRFNDCIFSEPTALGHSTLPRCGGVYVILSEDGNWAPKPFQPLYFGEFGNNMTAAVLLREAGRFTAAAHGKSIYLAVLAMPFSTTSQRWALCRELISAYNPVCQTETHTPPLDLMRQLDELEKKHQEQTAQLMWLRASADHLLGPAPERRRRIGFLPETLPAV
jgi:hypothetical protein